MVDDAVEFPRPANDRPSATRALLGILRVVTAAFPETFSGVRLPGDISSRRSVAELLLDIEIKRIGSPRRAEIASTFADEVQRTFVLRTDDEAVPLEHAFSAPCAPLPIEEIRLSSPAHDWSPRQDMQLVPQDDISIEAVRALDWVATELKGSTATDWDLRGQRFLLLGGTAEMGPLSRLLAAGADVLTTHTNATSLARAAWLDLPPATEWRGRLFAVPGGVNLLGSLTRLVETALAFSHGRPLHVGALAYRGGQGREWRLVAAMDGITRALRRANVVSSITWYLSPSVPTELSAATARIAIDRWSTANVGWRHVLRALTGNALLRPNVVSSSGHFLSSSFVSRQGASYMAGNLCGKHYVAETCLSESAAQGEGRFRVSANVAPLTATRSTRTPATDVLFPRLGPLGIRVFDPAHARDLMFRLMLSDLFGPPRAPGSMPFDKQVHGGIFTNPLALESVLKRAYLRGRGFAW